MYVTATLRSLIAPTGFGKTTAVHVAAVAASACGLPVLGVATTNRAVAELRDIGVPAITIARLALEIAERPFEPCTVVVLDEASQTATADAVALLAAVVEARGARLPGSEVDSPSRSPLICDSPNHVEDES